MRIVQINVQRSALRFCAILTLFVVSPVRHADAAMIIYGVPAGSTTGGQPVNVKATITTSPNQVVVLLENLQADPKSVVQCISGFRFHLDSGQTSGSLTSSSGTERTIAANGSFSDGGSASSGWSLSTVASDLKLDLLGTPAAPDHTIIGPPAGTNSYDNANSSITNGTHSPFFGLSATFTLNVPGVTAASGVSSATFQFNTGAGNTVPGTQVPEPVSCLILPALLLVCRRGRSRTA